MRVFARSAAEASLGELATVAATKRACVEPPPAAAAPPSAAAAPYELGFNARDALSPADRTKLQAELAAMFGAAEAPEIEGGFLTEGGRLLPVAPPKSGAKYPHKVLYISRKHTGHPAHVSYNHSTARLTQGYPLCRHPGCPRCARVKLLCKRHDTERRRAVDTR